MMSNKQYKWDEATRCSFYCQLRRQHSARVSDLCLTSHVHVHKAGLNVSSFSEFEWNLFIEYLHVIVFSSK